MHRPALLLAAAAALLPPAAALTRDQAAQVDWHAKHIGVVSHAFPIPSAAALVTASLDDGVVASLDAATGGVRWRRPLDAASKLVAAAPLDPTHGDGAVTVTAEPGDALIARAWRAGDGGLLWQAAVGDGGNDSRAAVAVAAGVAVIATDAAVVGLNAATGARVWDAASPIPAGGGGPLAARAVDATSTVAVASAAAVAHVDAASGAVAETARPPTGSTAPVLTAAGALAYVRGGAICALHPSSPTPRCARPPAAAGECTALVAGAVADAVAAVCSGGVVGVKLSTDASPTITTAPLPGTAAAVAADGAPLAIALDADASALAVAGEKAPTGLVSVPGWTRPNAAAAPPAAAAAAWAVGATLIIRSSDGGLAAVAVDGSGRAATIWVRDDSLSRPAAALFAPLPPPSAALPAPSHLPVAQSLRMEWLALKSRLPRGLTAAETSELSSLRSAAAGRSAPTADARGFRQAALLLTRGGALVALHSGDGSPLWRAPAVAPPSVNATLLRVGGSPPTVGVVWRGGYTIVDAFTGAVVEEGGHPLHAASVVPLPTASDAPPAYLLVGDAPTCASCGGDGPRVAAWPPAARAAADAAAAAAPLRFWVADSDAGTLSGYAVDWPPAQGAVATSRLAWRHAFGPGRLLAAAAPPRAAPRAAAARVLGDRSMKLRLAPDALAFVASLDASGAVTASIVDGASGQCVFRQTHAGVGLPTDPTSSNPVAAANLHAVWAGSTLVYSVRAPVSDRVAARVKAAGGATSTPSAPTTLVGALDLYDAARGTNLTAARLALGARPAGDGRQASFAPPPPDVLRATFSLAVPPAALSVTATERGITPPLFLIATPDGQAYGVPGAALDPRRPVAGATPPPAAAAAAAEGLPPYHPDVPLPPSAALTHGARVARPAGFAASPAGLESTSLVLVYGLDAFGTRAQPAASFDRLPDDFPRALLLAVTAAVAGGAAFLRAAAQGEAIKQAWR